jgi:hypothetical protein
LTGSTVPLPDFTSEGRPARVVVSPSARTNAGRTLDIVSHRLERHRGGRWLDTGQTNGSRHWSIGTSEEDIDVEIQPSSDMLLQDIGPACITITTSGYDALKVQCRRADALRLWTEGPSATTAWAVTAARLALAHGRSGRPAPWKAGLPLIADLRGLMDEDVRYDGGYVAAVHPSQMSDAGAIVAIELSRYRHCVHELRADDASFLPLRPCRLIARSRNGAGGVNAGAPSAVQLLVPTVHVRLERLDAMDVLRLHAATGMASTPRGRRRR